MKRICFEIMVKNAGIPYIYFKKLSKIVTYLFWEFQGMKSLIFLHFRVRQKLLVFS